MKPKAQVDSKEAFLHAHGIRVAPSTFEEMVREAVLRLPSSMYRPDPKPDLTAAEVAVLERGGFNLDPTELGADDPLAQTSAEYAALLMESLPTSSVAERLGVDPSRIRQRLTSDPPSLYGIRLESGWVIPKFQLEGNKTIPGIADVVARLSPELHPVAFFRWFHQPNPDLVVEREGEEPRSLSPRDWLRFGFSVEQAAELAAYL
jgi:hypothetical protein